MTHDTSALDATLDSESMFKTWEFKGIEIKPLSYARKWQISKLVNMADGTPYDMAMCIFLFICKKSDLSKGLRNNAYIDNKFEKWLDKVELEFSDFGKEAGQMITEVMEHSQKNQAEPIINEDPSMTADPVGNY